MAKRAKTVQVEQDDEDIIVTTDPVDEGDTQTAAGADDTQQDNNQSSDQMIEDLKRQLEEEKTRSAAEAARAAKAEQERNAAATSATDHFSRAITERENSLAANLTSIQATVDQLENQLKAAKESGDYAAEARVIRDLSIAGARLDRAEQDKANFDAWKEQQKNAPVHQPAEAQPAKFTPATQAWIDAHPRFNTDQEYRAVAIHADGIARMRGIAADTPQYFKFVEDSLDKHYGTQQTQQRYNTTTPSTSAPVSRDNGGNGGMRPNQVRLTAEEREAAAMMGMTDTEYAKYKIKAQNEDQKYRSNINRTHA